MNHKYFKISGNRTVQISKISNNKFILPHFRFAGKLIITLEITIS